MRASTLGPPQLGWRSFLGRVFGPLAGGTFSERRFDATVGTLPLTAGTWAATLAESLLKL
jgi:hypothetical protein